MNIPMKQYENERIQKEKEFWNKAASRYDTPSGIDIAYERSINKCHHILSGTDHVLELACGTGKIAFGIADCISDIVATDISEEMIKKAKEKQLKGNFPNISFEVGDGYHTRFEKETFDAVLLFNVLHVVKEPDTLLDEAFRILKPNGYLITATDCYGEKLSFRKQIYHTVPKLMKKLGIVSYLSSYGKTDLLQRISSHKFSICETDILYDAPLNYYVLAKKQNGGLTIEK